MPSCLRPRSPLEGTGSIEDISRVPNVCGRGREDWFVGWVEGGSGQVAHFMFIVRIP